jgi:aspartate racemase
MNKNKQVIGLIGGMGPFASAEFLKILLEKSSRDFGAKNCDEFPEIVLDSIPVPDFISDKKSLPAAKKMLIDRVLRLNKFGCTTIVIVCNTGHIMFPALSSISSAKMISIIDSVRSKVIERGFKRVGLLATKTTIKSNLFTKVFSETKIIIVNPTVELMELSEIAIRNVISNELTEIQTVELIKMVKEFILKNSLDGIILGCTELPLVFKNHASENFVDCLDVLADELLVDHYSD